MYEDISTCNSTPFPPTSQIFRHREYINTLYRMPATVNGIVSSRSYSSRRGSALGRERNFSRLVSVRAETTAYSDSDIYIYTPERALNSEDPLGAFPTQEIPLIVYRFDA